ncbi:hypothetical protein [Pedobacter montanisoli]|uniref:Uncharacterized protein n=1 Tax=Pedobacter montanisoli TaxID=2923277 RepID=A0ABS9ZTV7_9SPHI|nr:hypothetical protein [Pedobacter montanisoli]MCJ0742031.1 hypothetical protein [Pedobacter montanisoli]
MKRLSNVSPFLLLLFPVIMVMLLGITLNSANDNQDTDIVVKTNTPAKTVVKIASSLLK